MTEAEWFSEIEYGRHLQFLRDRLSARQSRLLAVAFCRCVLRLHGEPAIVQGLEAAEEFADGRCTVQNLEAYRWQFRETAVVAHEQWLKLSTEDPERSLNYSLLSELAWATAYTTAQQVALEDVAARTARTFMQAQMREVGSLLGPFHASPNKELLDQQRQEFRALVWDVAGNPFATPVDFARWRTSTVAAIARGMYLSRDFSALPILADALEDAGCDDVEVLAHCRTPGAHVRGCWVLDQILKLS